MTTEFSFEHGYISQWRTKWSVYPLSLINLQCASKIMLIDTPYTFSNRILAVIFMCTIYKQILLHLLHYANNVWTGSFCTYSCSLSLCIGNIYSIVRHKCSLYTHVKQVAQLLHKQTTFVMQDFSSYTI